MSKPILPDAYIEVLDGALGLMSDFPSGVFAQVGRATQGPVASPKVFTESDKVEGVFGDGDLATALKVALLSGARMVLGVRMATSIPGSFGQVTRRGPTNGFIGPVTKQGTGSGTVTVTGTPVESGLLEMQIVTGGEVGTAAFKWRLSGGTWSAPITTGASVPIPACGVVTSWSNGAQQPSFVMDDLFSCTILTVGTGQMLPGGSPNSDYQVEVQATATGGLNAAKFRYRTDPESLWSPEQTVQSSFVIPDTGITLQFVEGNPSEYSFLAGETMTFGATGPSSSSQDLMDAIDSLLAVHYPIEFIHVVGPTGPDVWAALQAKAEEFAEKYRYLHILCETRGPDDDEDVDEWVEALLEDAQDFAGTRVSICAGRVAFEYRGMKIEMNAAPIYAGHLSRIKVHQSPGRVIDGPIPFATEVAPVDDDGRSKVNDGHIALLDATGKFITVRRYVGQSGIYITNGRMKVDDTSDFRWVEWRRVMDKACREVRLAALRSVHKEATPEGLKALQADCQQPLNIMKGAGEVYDAQATIPDGQDFIATSTVRVKVRIQPVPTMRWIEVEMGFENPFRQAA